MGADKNAKTIVVTGDFTLDWNLARGRGPEALNRIWEAAACSRLRWQRGGAGLLADLIDAIAKQNPDQPVYEVRQPQSPKRTPGTMGLEVSPEDLRYHHSFAVWMPYEFALKGSGAAKGREKVKAWRVAEFEGVHNCSPQDSYGDWAKVASDDPKAELVVLDDAGLGFRDDDRLWPASLTAEGSEPWVLVKMSRPVADTENKLWKLLCERHSKKLVVVMTVNDLRRTSAQISNGLSWERTAQDLVWEFEYNQSLASLKNCCHVVVSFDAAGAFLYSHDAETNQNYSLLFDPEVVEGMWEKTYPGRMIGYSSCLIAGIAREWMFNPTQPNIQQGICAGLWALRNLHCEGYGKLDEPVEKVRIEFPTETVVQSLTTFVAPKFKDNPFQIAMVPMRSGIRYWAILADNCKNDLDRLATDVVLHGTKKTLTTVPLGRFGKLLTVDRQEIESLRSIGSLMTEYLTLKHPERPLSIAVFGPPGSGKSFGIKQLALSVQPGEIEVKEFNLSQLRSFDGLISAFHQVRDIGLSGKIPLVFWDEFDSDFDGENYGWLRYFLAPMQDGVFQQGDLPHPIGKAIFVFAGGTSSTLESFGKFGDEEKLRAAKVPDFVSRLKGFLNVLGPNKRTDVEDPFYVLRRAILLRSMLERSAEHLVPDGEAKIDSGVLRAFLLVNSYRHGARSMESLLNMSQLNGKVRFERSSLPPKVQLELHVDGQNLLALVHQLKFNDLTVDNMAKEAHEIYCEQQIAEGWKFGTRKNELTRENPSLVDYDLLSDEEKEENRKQVRDIPGKLAYAGCTIVRTREGDQPFVFPTDLLEELAEREHMRWMRSKVDNGWRYAERTDKPKMLHNCMLPWEKGKLDDYVGFAERLGEEGLSEEEKEKDRSVVRGMIRILNVAGFTITGANSKAGQLKKK